MEFKRFHIGIIIRVLLLTFSLALFSFCLIEAMYLRSAYAGALVVIQVTELIFHITRFTRNITVFLESVRQRDFSIHFTETKNDKHLNNLYESLNALTTLFKKISVEKEIKHRYLETLVKHVSFGIISFDEHENVMLVNEAFKKLSGIVGLEKLSQVQAKNPLLSKEITALQPGKKKVIKLPIDNKMITLSLYSSEFKLDEQAYKLVSVQNITNELSATEIEAWQRLISVLTHEIMNSISPITSLSSSLHELTSKEPPDQHWKTVHTGLDAIKTRSEGLLNFTQRYRKLTQVPTPEFQTVQVNDFIGHIIRLVQPEIEKRSINIKTEIQAAKATFDPALAEQAIINLIQNAIDAMENTPHASIFVSVLQQSDRIRFAIQDNGPGINAQDLDNIFVPFFTTKKNGSGIGLALARQIAILHGGEIAVQSELGKGATFVVTL
ncbi:MAG TPA: HAMP domain-containing sensor histidine kinase [Cyclobacteriaceae bacterium]|nr:HAMP domain-containing sensor histidine kinase [Cyclobacteriaceae bacterium]